MADQIEVHSLGAHHFTFLFCYHTHLHQLNIFFYPNFIEYFALRMHALRTHLEYVCAFFLFFFCTSVLYCIEEADGCLLACCLAIHRISSMQKHTVYDSKQNMYHRGQYSLRAYHLLFASSDTKRPMMMCAAAANGKRAVCDNFQRHACTRTGARSSNFIYFLFFYPFFSPFCSEYRPMHASNFSAQNRTVQNRLL